MRQKTETAIAPAATAAATEAAPGAAATAAAPARAGGFTVYPGAKLDSALSTQATKSSQGTMDVNIYVATAPFDKVAAFYKAKYKEDKSGEPPTQVEGARSAVFILDRASGGPTKHYLQVKENGASTLLYDTISYC